MENRARTEPDERLSEHRKALQSRTASLPRLPQGVVHRRPRSMHQLRVVRNGDQLQLFFFGRDSREVLSRMNVHDPLDLVSPYTQAMILALLWQENPKYIYMLGFGAGRVPMILHHYLPDVVIESTELDPDVVEVAAAYFGVAFDRRLVVAVEDGRAYLQRRTSPTKYEIIFVDAFRGTGNSPYPLATREFYQLCKGHLAATGVVSVNWLNADTLFADKVSTIAASFRNVYVLETDWGGSVFFATDADSVPRAELVIRAARILERHRFVFPFLEHARNLHQIAEDGRLIDPSFQGRVLSDRDPPASLSVPSSALAHVGRNDDCPCGSGKKFKKCHGSSSSRHEEAPEPGRLDP